MFTELLPPAGYPIAVKYIIYHIISYHTKWQRYGNPDLNWSRGFQGVEALGLQDNRPMKMKVVRLLALAPAAYPSPPSQEISLVLISVGG